MFSFTVLYSVAVLWVSNIVEMRGPQIYYRQRSRGDSTFGSIRVCVRPFVCAGALLFEPFDL